MLKSLVSSSIDSLKIKLTLIYILNALDIVFTFTLLKTGLFFEVNGLMTSIVEDPFLSILVKLIIPAFLITYLIYRLNAEHQAHVKLCNFLISLVLLMYLCIDLLHIFYTYAYFIAF